MEGEEVPVINTLAREMRMGELLKQKADCTTVGLLHPHTKFL